MSTQNVASDQEKEPSDHDDRSEGEIRLLERIPLIFRVILNWRIL